MNFFKKVIIFIIFTGIFIILFLYANTWYMYTDFYKKCGEVKIGMPKEEVEEIMKDFISDKVYTVLYYGNYWENGNLVNGKKVYIYHETSDNWCEFPLDENNKVKNTILYFEP